MCGSGFAHRGQAAWEILRADGLADLRGLRTQRSGPSLLCTTRAPPGCPQEARGARIIKQKITIRPWQKKHRMLRIPEQGQLFHTSERIQKEGTLSRSHSKLEAKWKQSKLIPGEALPDTFLGDLGRLLEALGCREDTQRLFH